MCTNEPPKKYPNTWMAQYFQGVDPFQIKPNPAAYRTIYDMVQNEADSFVKGRPELRNTLRTRLINLNLFNMERRLNKWLND